MNLLIEKGDYLLLGIDGGGSNCRAVIANPAGDIIGRGTGGSANPLHGFERTIGSILTASRNALGDAGLSASDSARLVAGIGLAGLNLPEMMTKMQNWQSPFYRTFYTTDLDVANIGAHGGHDGAVIIVGTGSCGIATVDEQNTKLGGYGFPVGDNASGAWLGLRAVQQALYELDGFVSQSNLTEAICEFFEVNTATELSAATVGHTSKCYARIAGLVIAAADRKESFAMALVDEGCQYIEQLIERLTAGQQIPLALLGGLADIYRSRLAAEFREKISAAQMSAEEGAIKFATQSLQKEIANNAAAGDASLEARNAG